MKKRRTLLLAITTLLLSAVPILTDASAQSNRQGAEQELLRLMESTQARLGESTEMLKEAETRRRYAMAQVQSGKVERAIVSFQNFLRVQVLRFEEIIQECVSINVKIISTRWPRGSAGFAERAAKQAERCVANAQKFAKDHRNTISRLDRL